MSMCKTLAATILAGTMLFAGSAAAADKAPSGTASSKDGKAMELVQERDKVFPRSDKVEHRKVTFRTRYGTVLAGDLYVPRDARGKLAALAVSGPFGAVKEQASGLYAQTMAERGFLTLAFDPSYTGESSGEPRHVASPDINTEDFSAAVDFLTTLDAVDAERIGIIGICGFGGMGLNAAAMDTRIKATVAVTMYDMSRVTANGYFDAMDAEARYALRQQLNAQRTRDARSGSIAPSAAGLPEALTGDEPQFVKDYFDYYKTRRGFHPRSINSNGAWNATSALSFLNMPLLAYAGEIRSAVLLVHGEKAHSRYFSEDAFKKLSGNNKELMIVPRASHTDLYDRVDIIPFDRIEAFFQRQPLIPLSLPCCMMRSPAAGASLFLSLPADAGPAARPSGRDGPDCRAVAGTAARRGVLPDHALRFRQGRREADRLKSPSPWGIMAYGFPSSRPGRAWTFAVPPAGQGALPGGVWCAGPLRCHAAVALWHSFC